jgi:type I restriction enzyme, S subunit
MAGEWETVELQELVEPDRGISYGIVQPGSPIRDGIPIVRVSDIRNGRVSTADPLRVSPDIEQNYARTRLRGGELLLTLVGTVGEAAIVPEALAGWNTARAVAVIPVRTEVGPYWIRLALSSSEARHIIDSRVNTTVQTTLNLRDVARLPIVLPPKREREAIAHILGTLDDKIELNRRMNETLEAMARALFKSWFVDFDPVRAKAEGRSSSLPEAFSGPFSYSLNESELGEIPSDWRVGELQELASVFMGLSPDGESYNANGFGTPLINGPVEFGEYFPVRSKWTTSPSRLAEFGDLIFCVRGSTTGRRVVADGVYCLGRGVCALRPINTPRAYLYLLVNNDLQRLLAKTTGSVFPSLSAPDIKRFLVLIPSQEVLAAFERIAQPIIVRIEANVVQSMTLAALRHTLLPKLISGELRVKAAQKLVEAVA